MPLCGFDEQMLEGLGMFYKGLSNKKEINNEIDYLNNLLEELKK